MVGCVPPYAVVYCGDLMLWCCGAVPLCAVSWCGVRGIGVVAGRVLQENAARLCQRAEPPLERWDRGWHHGGESTHTLT